MSSSRDFEDRVARLEERLVDASAEDYLVRAERAVAAGSTSEWARLDLALAKLAHLQDEWNEA